MVQLARKAKLDAATGNYWNDLADPLSDHLGELWICLRASLQGQSQLAGRVAICDQPVSEFDLHTRSVWLAKLTTCSS